MAVALAPRPVILKVGDELIVRSGWRTWLWTLGARHRRVVVSPRKRVLRVVDRRFWLFRSTRRVEFEWIARVLVDDYDWGFGTWASGYTQQDLLLVGLALKNNDTVTLFRYYCQGDFVNDSFYPDWMMWDEIAASALVPGGAVANEAQRLASVLSGLIGVPVE